MPHNYNILFNSMLLHFICILSLYGSEKIGGSRIGTLANIKVTFNGVFSMTAG